MEYKQNLMIAIIVLYQIQVPSNYLQNMLFLILEEDDATCGVFYQAFKINETNRLVFVPSF
jgi:hypothetical protein